VLPDETFLYGQTSFRKESVMRGDSAEARGKRTIQAENARDGLRQLIERGDPHTVAIIDGAMAAVCLKPPASQPDLRGGLTARLAGLDAEEVVHVLMVHQRLSAGTAEEARA
jgi:hypothetical protein